MVVTARASHSTTREFQLLLYLTPCLIVFGPPMNLLDKIPLPMLLIIALALGLAPVSPQPHLWEKLNMLMDGTLSRPIDIFDLLMHSTPVILLVLKLVRMHTLKHKQSGSENN